MMMRGERKFPYVMDCCCRIFICVSGWQKRWRDENMSAPHNYNVAFRPYAQIEPSRGCENVSTA